MIHFIRKQYLQVELTGSESEGFALQNQLPDLFHSKLLPAIEAALDKCSPPGQLLVIDRLEVDAGTVDLNMIDQNLAIKVAEAMVESIEKEIASGTADKNDHDFSFFRHETEKVWDAFILFLQNGNLPWSFKLPEGKNLEEVVAETLLDSKTGSPNLFPSGKIAEVLSVASAAKRLALQFSESFIRMLLEKMEPGIKGDLDHLQNQIDNIPFASGDSNLVRTLILEKTVSHVAAQNQFSKTEIEKQVLFELRAKTELFLLVSKAFENTWLDVKVPEFKQTTTDNFKVPEDNIQEVKEGIFIDNAGLILLHPFLPRFFETLGVSNENELIQPAKALGLLHFLVRGQTRTPEYELVLPKILCNLPLSATTASEIDFLAADLEEASALLDAVITHWEALGKTSQDGLRGSFLLRPGKLTLKNDGDWLLQVEQRGFDILLEQLPWSISMIKLPWMEKMLWVEWRD